MAYQSFEELDVWKRSVHLSIDLTNSLKKCKDYTFKDQVLRSALSIPSNIAEGAERNSINNLKIF